MFGPLNTALAPLVGVGRLCSRRLWRLAIGGLDGIGGRLRFIGESLAHIDRALGSPVANTCERAGVHLAYVYDPRRPNLGSRLVSKLFEVLPPLRGRGGQ